MLMKMHYVRKIYYPINLMHSIRAANEYNFLSKIIVEIVMLAYVLMVEVVNFYADEYNKFRPYSELQPKNNCLLFTSKLTLH